MKAPYSLELHSYQIREVQFGTRSSLADGALTVYAGEVEALVLEDPRIASADLQLARPGEPVRIVHVLDVVEPRLKVEGSGTVFPGFLGGPETVGAGVTLRLSGIGVMTSSRFPQPFEGLLAAREAIVDMAGESAKYSPLSRWTNLVLALKPPEHLDNADYDDAVRRASLKVAHYLASLAMDQAPQRVDILDISKSHPELPTVACFYQLQGQGSMADTYLYGHTIENLVPTLIHPNEVMDGAIVGGVHVYVEFKNPTRLHQNNPVIEQLYRRHGKEVNFAWVILNRGHNYTQMEKERSSCWAAKLARHLQADGVILTGEGGGNSAIDLMLACKYMEQDGMDTTVLTYESPGPDGTDFPLIYTVPEADALVSIGTDQDVVVMPEVDRVIGDDLLLDHETQGAGPFTIRIYALYTALEALKPDLLVAGPAFNAGRYGLACAAVCDLASSNMDIPSPTGVHPAPPAVEVYRRRVEMVPTGSSAGDMVAVLKEIARIGLKLAHGAALSPAEPILDLHQAAVDLVTEGGMVPLDNPDEIESSNATRWARYPIAQLEQQGADGFRSIHPGYGARWVNQDPNRLVPVDAARDLERRGEIGKLHEFFCVTVGTGTSVKEAGRMVFIGNMKPEHLAVQKRPWRDHPLSEHATEGPWRPTSGRSIGRSLVGTPRVPYSRT